jgi:hypothetical protein
VSAPELVGSYTENVGAGWSRLSLGADGTYRLAWGSGDVIGGEQRGRWRIEFPYSGEPTPSSALVLQTRGGSQQAVWVVERRGRHLLLVQGDAYMNKEANPWKDKSAAPATPSVEPVL